jgi:UDP-N-acetylmuramoylalanine--D-glutamate ligase
VLAGRRVLVAGAGVSGRSVVDALLAAGARVTVTDANPDRLAALRDRAEVRAGLDVPPAGTELVVTSPGWTPRAPLLVAAAEAGIEVIGEVELAWRFGQQLAAPPVWLAVTGTNGKTTTVGMAESILRAAGVNAVACGNVGFPVIDAVRAGHEVLAVELSSFQLHWQKSLRPKASVVLNVAEDHLDWHGSMAEYAAAKGRIYAGADVAVINVDDEWSVRLAANKPNQLTCTLGEPAGDGLGIAGGWLVHGGERLCPVEQVRPPGRHNLANALAAAALARVHGVPATAVRDGLRAFEPGAHRAELVGEWHGVRYINDSKATNPHAAACSLRAHPSVVWLAGGQLKGARIDELVVSVADRLRGVVVLGADREVISASLARHAPDVPVHRVAPRDDEPMIAAVRAAGAMARPGDVVLLAPAAASLDMFRDYAERGEAFAKAVAQLHGAG